jgi:hypothetical protein
MMDSGLGMYHGCLQQMYVFMIVELCDVYIFIGIYINFAGKNETVMMK